jgi:hypothetical protein
VAGLNEAKGDTAMDFQQIGGEIIIISILKSQK